MSGWLGVSPVDASACVWVVILAIVWVVERWCWVLLYTLEEPTRALPEIHRDNDSPNRLCSIGPLGPCPSPLRLAHPQLSGTASSVTFCMAVSNMDRLASLLLSHSYIYACPL